MGQDFLTLENVMNFSFLIVVVVVATEFTKRLLGKDRKVRTELIVFVYSLLLSISRVILSPGVKWGCCSAWFVNVVFIFVNAMLIGYFAISGYGKLVEGKNGESKRLEDKGISE